MTPSHCEKLARVPAVGGGLERIIVMSDVAKAEMCLHGAHITHFQPRGKEPLLFLSENSFFETTKAIRGGVPICFPWFGPHSSDSKLPQHGFARTSLWELQSTQEQEGDVVLVFKLQSNSITRQLWPQEFEAKYSARIGGALEISLQIHNRSDRPIRFEEALHSYLHVGDVRKIEITGLEEAEYLDKTSGGARVEAAHVPLRLSGETDRVYLGTRSTCIIHDALLQRKIVIEKSNSENTVIWNPWSQKIKSMKDLAENEWPKFVCVETANVGNAAVALEPGESHTMTATIRAQ